MSKRVYKFFIVTVRIITVFQIAYLALLFIMRDQMISDAWHGAYNDEPSYMAANLSVWTGVDYTDDDGVTLLMIASQYGKLANVRYLLEHGADKRLRNAEGKTAYDLVQEKVQNTSYYSNESVWHYKEILALTKP